MTSSADDVAIRYAADRAEIENLQARYLFALDWQDGPAYASTFAEDGVLDWAGGIVQGRAAIAEEVAGMRANFAKLEAAIVPKRPSRLRHYITNIVLKIEGDRATGRAYWFETNNDNRGYTPYVGGYGHYEDELRKVDGHWLFTRRKIWNEIMADRTAPMENPAW
ncbi:MAG: nuclear transport factor 2 family protein [Aliidongia sp.]